MLLFTSVRCGALKEARLPINYGDLCILLDWCANGPLKLSDADPWIFIGRTQKIIYKPVYIQTDRVEH